MIPEDKRQEVVSHIVMVHLDVVKSSKLFQQRLRRNNYVTPKNYLDFINSYLKLLEEKDKYILALVSTELQALHWSEMLSSLAEITYFDLHYW